MASGCAAGLIRLWQCACPQLLVLGWPWVPALSVVSVVVRSALTVAHKTVEIALGLATLLLGCGFDTDRFNGAALN